MIIWNGETEKNDCIRLVEEGENIRRTEKDIRSDIKQYDMGYIRY